ncbi:integral membrane sensor signal transduction histidine kinase [Syntrophobotulus glycolicus DSM 8271]|uniref:histidine kinase n=1 Tax=Syntrophobotulus glycolicus (strain DSM 8271 / FlGlyR) TaxID=645991 RepID=F0T036_SYNGF|nr:HAMP domain-containing sensor histidine kinase [Syntrophobotulus glycolicus]ADY56123.1 integral membrane sensor signal transduction histidine kinase [Syntrophobotulus glycolicus DSM 8271]
MRGIRARLTVNFMIVIMITVTILEILLIYAVRQNYYASLRSSLTSQIKISADLYAKYFSDTSLQENILYNVDAFWNQSNAEVEIVDKDGKIVMDSLGVIQQDLVAADDISEALEGRLGEWIGMFNGQKVMSVAYPLKSNNEIVGALRFIASLSTVDQDIQNTAKIFISIGLLVIFIAGLISIFLANTIIVPLKEVTKAAQEIAAGNFKARSRKTHEDEIGKLSDTLNYMADEIVKKEQLKNDFISSVSHELRTPLTSIMGWAITLQNEQFQQKDMLKDGLNIIAKESERLTHMVEELLDFSKFVSGRIKLHNEPIHIVHLMEHIHKQLTPRAVRENINFSLCCPEDLPCLVSDINRLKQLFINILDNAFNFTPAGGSIMLKAENFDKEIRFTISDSGCGISTEELPMVKEKFYKGKSSRSKNGIGLSICEEIVVLMKGQLEINSELDQGTTVRITLPQGEVLNE